jgi:hypothetical protein
MLVRNKYSKSGEDRIITLWYQVSFTTLSLLNSVVFLSLCAMSLFLIITIFCIELKSRFLQADWRRGNFTQFHVTKERRGGLLHVPKDTTQQYFRAESRKWPQNVRHRPGFEQGTSGIINPLFTSQAFLMCNEDAERKGDVRVVMYSYIPSRRLFVRDASGCESGGGWKKYDLVASDSV